MAAFLCGEINNCFGGQQLQQFCRLLFRAVIPLDCPYSLGVLTCRSLVHLEGERKGHCILYQKIAGIV